jgi:hypothetical protein
MGYSNVQGSLNVLSSTSTQDLVVRGETLHLGNIVSTQGYATFGNVAIANLVVTGNFTITATNTQTTNALSINNAGTATALKVTQFEGGGSGHVHNVAEFWDFTTLAMVIDPEGNVGIHTSASPGAALTVVGGAIVDTLALGTPLTVASGGTGTATTTNNWVFAGPSIGSAGPPSFRFLTNTDLPQSIAVSNVTANGATLYALNSSNLVGNVANANVALVVSQPLQPNITSVGTTGSLFTVNGLLIAANASGLSNINSSNLVGNVANANVALVVSQPLQPNITSVGTTGSLFTVNGLMIAANASGLSNINSSNLVGNVANANVALVVSQPLQPNITSVGTAGSLFTVNGLLIASNASGLSNINSSNLVGNVANANVALVVSQPSQPNITSVGLLSNLAVSNSVTTTNVVATQLTIPGALTANATNTIFNFSTLTIPFIYSTTLNVSATANASLFSGGGGGLVNLNSSALVGNVANSNVALVVSQPLQPNITAVGTVSSLFTVNGLLVAANASGLSNINSSNLVGNVANANVALVVSQPLQPNITSVGTVSSLFTVNGLLIASNASGLSNINSSNLVGNVANANVALVVSQPLQPNITSVGTISSLFTVNGLLVAANASGLSNINSSNLVGNVANANVALVVSQPLQPNITSVGTVSSLFTVNGLLIAGNASGLSNINSSNLVGNVANANVALVVSQPDQPNITSVGLLTNLAVTNSLTTTNVFISNGLDVGPGTLGTNVVVFSNVSGGSNVFVMDANGRVGIGTAAPTFPLSVITSSSPGTGATLGGFGTSVETRVRFLDENNSTSVPPGILGHNTGYGLGIYTNYGGSPIRFFTSGQVLANERMRITDTGVSILTGANPTSNLQLTGNAFISNALTTTNVFVSNGLDVGPGTLGTNVVVFSNISGGANTFVMDSNGRIGIGTTAPGYALDIGNPSGITNQSTFLRVGSQLGGASATAGIIISPWNGRAGGPSCQIIGIDDAVSSAHLTFWTAPAGGSSTSVERVRIVNNGSVGIGLVNPTSNLQVTGNAYVSNSLSTTNVFAVTATVPGFTSQFTVNGGGTVTWSSAGYLKWDTRVLVLPAWRNAAYATGGFWPIFCPTTGTIVSNGGTVTCTTAGIPIAAYFALYYRVVPGTTNISVQANFILKDYTDTTYSPDSNWILLAVRNGDGSEIKWMPGNTTIPLGGTFYTPSASYDKVQVAGTVVIDSARTGIFNNLYSANAVTTTNLFTAGFTSNATNTIFNFDTLTIPFVESTTLNVSSSSNLVTANILTLNASSMFGTTANILTLNATTANILTLNATTANATNLTVSTLANISTLNVYTSANILSGNLVTANITNLTVGSQANIFSANVQNLAVATPVAVNSGIFMNLNATYTLNSTGNWSGNIAGSITSNLFTLFAPNPVASWTKYGSNPLITGPTATGGFRFNQTGPYQFTVVITSDNNIKTIALSSNTSDVHSNLADPGVWLYCYRISVGQDPSVPVQIPFYVDSTTKYYYIDFEAVNKTGENIHRTAYTNVVAEGYTGSYVTLRPL